MNCAYGRLAGSIAVAALSGLAAAAAFGQEAAKPTLSVGEQWVFKQTTDAGKEITWSRRIVAVGADGVVDVQTAPDKTQQFDAAWNFIDPRGADYNRTPYKFPMKVGAEWSFSAKAGTAVAMENRNSYKVVAYEPVTVPAGTFDCFKVEGTSDTTLKAYNYTMHETYWYCPKVNFIGKVQRETTTRTRDTGSSHEKTESVLTSYTPKR
jgi:hypothetical protein